MNDSNSSSRRRRPGLALVGTLALAALTSCGGRASSPEAEDEPSLGAAEDEPSLGAAEDEPSLETVHMPLTFDVLELQLLLDTPASYQARCGAVEYAERIKVNMRTGYLSAARCRVNGLDKIKLLLEPAQLASVHDFYQNLIASGPRECTNGVATLTLGVEVDDEELLFIDAEHAGCPVPGMDTTFVSGAYLLYQVLGTMSQL